MSLNLDDAIEFLRWRAAWFAGHAQKSATDGAEIDAKMYQFVANELEEICKEFRAHAQISAQFGTQWAGANAGACPPSASDDADWNVMQFAHQLPDKTWFGLPGVVLKFSPDRSEMSVENDQARSVAFLESQQLRWMTDDASVSAIAMAKRAQ